MKIRIKIVAFCLFIFILTTDNLFSQQELFSVVSVTLTTSEQAQVDKLYQNSIVRNLWFVEVADIRNIQSNGSLDLWLPNLPCEVPLRAKHVESKDSKSYYWFGEVVDTTISIVDSLCSNAQVTLICKDGYTFGTLSIHESGYELYSLRPSVSVLVEKGFNPDNLICNMVDSDSIDFMTMVDELELRNWGPCPVDVLALYTDNADMTQMNIEERIELSMSQLNQALRSSDIVHHELEFILVGIENTEFGETGDIDADVVSLLTDPDIQNLRENVFNADIVILFSGDDYGTTLGAAAGSPVSTHISDALSYCIVQARSSSFLNVPAHEIVHLFGNQHHRCDQCDFWNAGWCGTTFNGLCNNLEGFQHGHFFRTAPWPFSNRKHTIMFAGHEDNERRRIQYFSNPDVEYRGTDTGREDLNDVARQLKNVACGVADFVYRDVPLYVKLNAPSTFCYCAFTNLSVEVSGNLPGPYTFTWFESYDGFSWGQPVALSPNYQFEMSCLRDVFIRVDVQTTTGETISRFQRIQGTLNYSESDFICTFPIASEDDEFPDETMIYPNPTTKESILTMYSEVDCIGELGVYNGSGGILENKELSLFKGINNINIISANLAPGIYIVVVRANDGIHINKLVKL